MKHKLLYSKSQTILLVLLRLIIGYHFLFEGIDKLLSPHWSSAPFLFQSNWLFSGMFHSLASNPAMLSMVNFLNIWGQIFIGIGLIVGLFSTTAAIFGAVMILVYYIAIPPFLESATFIDKNLFEFLGFLIIAFFPTSNLIGLDLLIAKYRGKVDE